MIPENKLNEKAFSILIPHASSALKLSDWQIKEKFSLYPVCVSDYYEKEKRKKFIEIWFNAEETSLICLFDINCRCNSAFICPDFPDTLTHYADYFNSIYEYDYIRCKWVLPDGRLSLKKLKDGICFMIDY
jgi:hypothetical protein